MNQNDSVVPRIRLALLATVVTLWVTPTGRTALGEGLPDLPRAFDAYSPDGWRLDAAAPIAYEDHPQFTYVVANVPPETPEDGTSPGPDAAGLVRRFILLKPDTRVFDDLIPVRGEFVRGVHVLQSFPPDSEITESHSQLTRTDGVCELTIRVAGQRVRLHLPPADRDAGRIAIHVSDGRAILPERPLASGVMPWGPDGMRMLERWDSAYRPGGNAPWDIGRPSHELVQAVEQDVIKPCRAVVLGCGTGTNAIYLAQHGFEVTGIDVAPTALSRAREKARKAGVEVRWRLADVTAPPALEPFDFVYDRGCYHGVRRNNAAGYVQALRGLARPGGYVLVLAGNANEERHYGPPRVKEEEIRGDFTDDFDFRWLRETQFDTATPGQRGALAWSILLTRKAEP